MCKSGVQIHNPQALRLLETPVLGVTARLILNQHGMNTASAVAYARRKASTEMNEATAADYAQAAVELTARVRS